MFRFEHPYLLYLLLLIPAMWLLAVLWRSIRNRKIESAIDPEVYLEIAPEVSIGKGWVKLTLYSLALASLAIALANPQFGSKTEEVKRKGVDIMVALDVSNSMVSEDLYPNRLERAKRSLEELLSYLRSDRFGIVVFAGESYVQLPITTDYSAAKLFLNNLTPDLITTQGTDIGNAVQKCLSSFDFDSPTSKAIIIISDGENHEESAMEAVEQAASQDVVVHTIGMGSIEGAPIPIYQQGTRIGFRKDNTGNTVVSKLDEEMLRQLASKGDGIFVRATNAESGMNYVFEEIEKLEHIEIGSKVYTDYKDRFQYFLFPAILLLIIELIITNKKSSWWEKLFAS